MSDILRDKIKLVVIIGTAIVVGELVWTYFKRRRDNRPPQKWRKVGEISDLLAYPIKSCGWIRIDEFDCETIGLQKKNIRDRTFMVVNEKGQFVTARQYPKLVQVKPAIEGDFMTLSAPRMPDVQVNISELFFREPIKANVWGEDVSAADAGEVVAEWFSRFILEKATGLRLVFYLSSSPTRDVREKNKMFKTAIREDTGALHDATSYMLINEDSVAELNTRIDHVVTALQFRPNFVVKGPSAFDEDKWKWVKIGQEVIFRNVKPCTRCVFTNIDPITAERHPEEEPLKTLKAYRMFKEAGDSPVMGIHLGLRQHGKIKLHDAVYVEDEN